MSGTCMFLLKWRWTLEERSDGHAQRVPCPTLIHASQCFHAVVVSICQVRLGPACLMISMHNTDPCFPMVVARVCMMSSMSNTYSYSIPPRKCGTSGIALAWYSEGLRFKPPNNSQIFQRLKTYHNSLKRMYNLSHKINQNIWGQTVCPGGQWEGML